MYTKVELNGFTEYYYCNQKNINKHKFRNKQYDTLNNIRKNSQPSLFGSANRLHCLGGGEL